MPKRKESSLTKLRRAWKARKSLIVEARALTDKAAKLRGESTKLRVEGKKPYRKDEDCGLDVDYHSAKSNKLRAEAAIIIAKSDGLSSKAAMLFAEGHELRARGNLLWADAVLENHGDVHMEWSGLRGTCSLEIPRILLFK